MHGRHASGTMLATLVLLGAVVLVPASALAGPPAGTPVAAMKGFPVPGTRWVLATTSADGVTRRMTWVVLENGVHRGQPIYRVTNGMEIIALDQATVNFVARLDREGRPVFALSPHEGQFDWPLWVGKRWISKFNAIDFVRGATFDDIETQWTVEAYEDVTVPAGTFRAFRLQSRPIRHQSVVRTVWYAPEPNVVVKVVAGRAGESGATTPEHSVTEMVELERK